MTFMNLPYIDKIEKIGNEFEYIIQGIPYDNLVGNKPGARFGPQIIREAYGIEGYNTELGVSLNKIKGGDIGNLDIVIENVDDLFEKITKRIYQLLEKNVIPIILGGDHSIALAELRAYAMKYGSVAMIHFDAHTDTWPTQYGEGYHDHGSSFYEAILEGILDTEHSIQIGLRGSLAFESDLDFAIASGMTLITAQELLLKGNEECAKKIQSIVGDRPVFITFDIDFLDPVYAPGTGTPEQGGISTWQTLELIRNSLLKLNIVGFDLVEVSSVCDAGEITGLVANRIIREFISILAYQKVYLGRI